MRKLALTLMAAVAATVAAAPASAVTIVKPVSVTFAQGVTSLVDNGKVFQDFDKLATGSTLNNNTKIYNSNVTDNGKTPNGSVGNYAAILGGGSYNIKLPAYAPVLSFLAGSIDLYNSVTLSLVDTTTNLNNTSTQTFTGAQLGTIGADGRITFDTGSSTFLISSVLFQSGQNSFEVDTLASAAPEPATWAMMILGFGFAGMGLRSRRRGKLALA